MIFLNVLPKQPHSSSAIFLLVMKLESTSIYRRRTSICKIKVKVGKTWCSSSMLWPDARNVVMYKSTHYLKFMVRLATVH